MPSANPTSSFTFEDRPPFMPAGESGKSPEALRGEVRVVTERYRGEYSRRPSEVGQALIGTLVRTLEALDLDEMPSSDRADFLGELDRFYEAVTNGEWESIKNGALAEFGTLKAFDGYPVFYPTPEDDRFGRVDLWVDLEEPAPNGATVVAVQVKALPMRQAPDRLLYPLTSEASIEALENKHAGQVRDPQRLRTGLSAMLEYCAQFDNVCPVCVVLPSPGGSEHSLINARTGEVSRDLAMMLQTELEDRIIFAEVSE